MNSKLNFTANQARSIAHESRPECSFEKEHSAEIETLYGEVKAKVLAASERGNCGEWVAGLPYSAGDEMFITDAVIDRLKSEGFKVQENWYRESYDSYVMNLDINWGK